MPDEFRRSTVDALLHYQRMHRIAIFICGKMLNLALPWIAMRTVPRPRRNRETGDRPVRAAARQTALALAALTFFGISGCRPSIDKANAYEAQYDQMMTVKAYPAALKSIKNAVDLDDTSSRRFLKLAEVQMALDQPAGAASAFQQALDLEPDNIEALQNLAILSVRGAQYDVSRRYIDPLLSLSPNDPAGLLASGALALGKRRFRDALQLSDKIIAALPERADGYILKARALDALGRGGAAIAVLEGRVATAADDRDLLVLLMSLYRGRADKKGIQATAIRLMPLFPGDPRYALESARAFNDQGKQDRVRAIIDDLATRFARAPDVMVGIGAFWRDTQSPGVARGEIAKLAAGSQPKVRAALADQLIDMGDPEQALALLGTLAPPQVNAANVDSQTHYARALLATGQTIKAKAKVDSVLAYDADNPGALLIRARIRLMARDYRGAITDAQLVTQSDDRSEDAARLVAQIYAAQGNNVLAAGAYGNLRQQFPGSFTALQAEVNWLLSQHRNEEAGQRVATFYHAYPGSGPARAFYRQICSATHAIACQDVATGRQKAVF